MTLMARLCALCSVCALMQMTLGDSKHSAGISMIGGLLMIHLVISGAKELCTQLLQADGLRSICSILIK